MSDGQIFISYRREDSAGYTRAIYDQLVNRFSKARVFVDVDAIEPGLAFDEVIDRAVGRCEVVLAMIGKRWLEPNAAGNPRINDPKDFVRVEIVAALSRNIRVIPVLLDGAVMPGEDVLPEPLRPLSRRNAIEISNTRFSADVDRLVDAVAKALGEPDPRRHATVRRSRRTFLYWALGAAAAAAGIVSVARFARVRQGDEPPQPDSVQADWRFCRKCQSLFFDGSPTKGVCPAGGLHAAEGFNFILPHDARGPGQADWRFCQKCQALFFDGYPTKGVCAAGGMHAAAGFNFILPHDAGGPGQADWKFCQKCQALFFDGYPGKGVCAAGDGHASAGFNFVLRHI